MPIAVITLDFDPLLQLGDTLVVRWQTVALAVVITATLIVVAMLARRAVLRADDLLFIVVGIVPGAVIGGRLGFALLHLDLYRTQPTTLFDPSVGGLELSLAVVGGLTTGGYVAHLLDAPVGRWLHVAILPLLLALGAGKLTMLLGGAGQGDPSDLPWAVAFIGPGPWSSLAPALPSHPAQAYEGLATLGLALVMAILLATRGLPIRDGRAFFLGLGLWALLRAAITLTWRDPAVVGPFPAGGVMAIGVGLGALVIFVAMVGQQRQFEREAATRGFVT